MNHGFKLRFDQMRESNPTREQEPDGEANHSPGSHRNLCLVWPDGRRAFFNYAYLIEGEFDPGNEKNSIQLHFSAYKITLQGYGLATLFTALLDHSPRFISVIDARYVMDADPEKEIVTDIFIEKAE
ncbi:hypothetical protein ACO2Q8_09215 [Larkinella sp. VNQ87]|uniref:hypothetical protein n=1 Tax=Larkinella sp. VNQ87 TaxID=3400921 RepID=UPI003C1175E5